MANIERPISNKPSSSRTLRQAIIQLLIVLMGYGFNVRAQTLLQPTGITAIPSPGSIQLKWTDNSTGESNYRVERKMGAGSFSAYATIGANITNYNDISVTPGLLHTYRVFAYVGASASPYSAEVSVTATILVQPTGISATALPGSIQVKWTDNSTGEANYRVERRVGAGNFSAYTTIGANSTNYNDTVVTSGTRYTYRVFAYIGSSASPYSEEASATAINPPTLGASLQGGNLVLTWPTNASGFALVYSTDLSMTNWLSNSVAPMIVGGNYTVTNPIAGENNFYRLRR